MHDVNSITCILQNAMGKALSATKIHFVCQKRTNAKEDTFIHILGCFDPEPLVMLEVNINYIVTIHKDI